MTYKLDVLCADEKVEVLKLGDEFSTTGIIKEIDEQFYIEIDSFNNIKKLESASISIRGMRWGVKVPSKNNSNSKVITKNFK